MKFIRKDVAPEIEARVQQVLQSWEGTRYRADVQIPQVGADCRSFVLGVLDSLYSLETDIGSLPPDIALHKPDVARAFLRRMARRFCCHQRRVSDGTIEPGDLVITSVPGGGPTHVAIAGVFPMIWDCIQHTGVRYGGLDTAGLTYEGHWRLPNKHVWPTRRHS